LIFVLKRTHILVILAHFANFEARQAANGSKNKKTFINVSDQSILHPSPWSRFFVFSKKVNQVLEHYTDKKQNTIFLIYMEIQMGAVVKSYRRKSFLKYEERRKYLAIYEEAVSHI
jgi:hypothetical protein